MLHTWQLQEAKAKFSEVVNRANSEGPQVVTRHGVEAVVVLSMEDFRALAGGRGGIVDLLAMPGADDVDLEPPKLQGPLALAADLDR